MKLCLTVFAGICILTVPIGSSAWAASPAYCALYAREFARLAAAAPVTPDTPDALLARQDQAYYRCLNLDEEPRLPSASAYFRPDGTAGKVASLDGAISSEKTGGVETRCCLSRAS